ncbi:MAG: phosphoglucomutase/phosphomannomutase family protein [Sphaerobacter sp.]|nr:phosphoglucomutase/phosphomannomutase family protein [Sphaerobacter sp.]
MTIHFGTDGWRAVIADQFTFDAVRAVARAYAAALFEVAPERRPRVVVGYDRRFASDLFARAAAETLAVAGVSVALARSALPTQVVSWAVASTGADGALVITASHNPPQYSGIKLKTASGASAPPALVRRVEAWLEQAAPAGRPSGAITECDPLDGYLEALARVVDLARIRAAGLTVVADAMFGPTAGLLPRLLGGDATETIEINTAHNPLFPGLKGPEPVERNLTRLKKVVADGGATVGVAFDGDGDRVGVVDERGEYVSTQHVFGLLTRYVLEVRKERGPIVRSVTGSAMVDRLAQRATVPVIETRTGFGWIAEAMQEEGAVLGGEESGGFAFGFHLPERDGVLSALLLLDYLVQGGKPLSALLSDLEAAVGPWCYRRVDVALPPETATKIVEQVRATEWPATIAGLPLVAVRDLDGVKLEFEDGSWLLLRPSGTEPLLRLYAEAPSSEAVDALLGAGRAFLGV